MQWMSVSSKSKMRVFFCVCGFLGGGRFIAFFAISLSEGLSTYFMYYSDCNVCRRCSLCRSDD
jgi:hypothetical protein